MFKDFDKKFFHFANFFKMADYGRPHKNIEIILISIQYIFYIYGPKLGSDRILEVQDKHFDSFISPCYNFGIFAK